MASSATADAEILLKRGSAAPSGWTPTRGHTVSVRSPHATTGKFFLETTFALRQSSKGKDSRKPITSMHEGYPGKPSFLGFHPLKEWTTAAAAQAAIPHFREWVDGGRRKQTAAFAAARTASKVEAEVAALGEELPQRYSKRRNVGSSASLSVNLVGGLLSAAVATASYMSPAEYNAAWLERSGPLHRAIEKRRAEPQAFDVSRVLGQSVADMERDSAEWRVYDSVFHEYSE